MSECVWLAFDLPRGGLSEGPTRLAEYPRNENLDLFRITDPLGERVSDNITDEELFWESTGNYLLYIDAAKV